MAYDSAKPNTNEGLHDAIESIRTNENEINNDLQTHKTNQSNPHNVTANQVSYDNSSSGLVATLVQSALDEIDSQVDINISDISTNKGLIDTITGVASGWADARIVEHNLDVADPPNGYYVRWENGLQIVYTDDLILTYTSNSSLDNTTYSFPATFVSSPQAICNYVGPVANFTPAEEELGILVVFGASTTGITAIGLKRINGLTDFIPGDTANVDLIAIGRWK